ncbi:MAG: PspA/IM30 family protein [Deltaproteobacteria bacterium]|nr:PspA/IM30 family protein [Deltaproteobacteria bacterium]
MGLLDRLSTVVKSNINDLMSKAEDPEKMLNQAIDDMEADHKKAKQQIVESLAMQKQIEAKLQRAREEAPTWEQKAMAALQAGNEELARQALEQKGKLDADIRTGEESVKTQSEYVGALKSSLAMLEAKIQEAKKKRDELVRRVQQVKRQQKQSSALQPGAPVRDAVHETAAFDNFDRMAEKIENLEAQVEAQRELFSGEEQRIAADEQLHALSVDDQLAALKSKLDAGGSAADQLRELKQKPADPVADQLAELKKKLQ